VVVGYEFATTSVSSPGFEEYLPTLTPDQSKAIFMGVVDDLKYADTYRRGFMLMQFTASEAKGTWHFVSTVKSRSYTVDASATLAYKFFNRVSTFAVCNQVGASCESADTTAAEIVAASTDGMTLIYSNSPKGEVGFVDISDISTAQSAGRAGHGRRAHLGHGAGHAGAGGGQHAYADFVNVSGKLVVVDIATRQAVASITLPGQPDSVAISKDGKYMAVVIENERDEDVNDGAPPQLPAGKPGDRRRGRGTEHLEDPCWP
jgi:hypothetical protein